MSAAERFATRPPARLQWHPAHDESTGDDQETFHLHVEFVHAHGVPAGQFTTFSTRADTELTGHASGDGASCR
jgi:hypothetical protein